MPAAYAHYIFGKKVYHKLPSDIQEIIKMNPEAYWIGLHGPDLLFYKNPLVKNKVNCLGHYLHTAPAVGIFERGKYLYQQEPSYVLLSYLLGFLCHFTLDSECHPYISMYMEEHGVGHNEIETDFDRSLMEESGYDPVLFDATRHLKRDQETEEKIALMYDGVSSKEIGQCIEGFHFYVNMLRCPAKAKAKIFKTVMNFIDRSHNFSGLVMDGEKNEACKESTVFLRDRLNKSVPVAVQLIEEYVDCVELIDAYDALPKRLNRNFNDLRR